MSVWLIWRGGTYDEHLEAVCDSREQADRLAETLRAEEREIGIRSFEGGYGGSTPADYESPVVVKEHPLNTLDAEALP